MNGKFILDTNVIIALFGADSAVIGRLNAADEVFVSAIARIKNDLRAIGKLIPENDIWIAAVASQHGLTLITRDHHFAAVSGLSIEAW